MELSTILLGSADWKITLHWRIILENRFRIKPAVDFKSVIDQFRTGQHFVLVAIDYALLADHFVENLSQLLQNASESKILLIGRKCSSEIQLQAFSLGVPGYMEADLSDELLIKGVDHILGGEVWVERRLITPLMEILRKQNGKNFTSSITRNLASLTPREIEIASGVCRGESNKKIANRLDISERTVKAHLSSIFRKLEVIDRLQLALELKDCFLVTQSADPAEVGEQN